MYISLHLHLAYMLTALLTHQCFLAPVFCGHAVHTAILPLLLIAVWTSQTIGVSRTGIPTIIVLIHTAVHIFMLDCNVEGIIIANPCTDDAVVWTKTEFTLFFRSLNFTIFIIKTCKILNFWSGGMYIL